MSQVIGGVRAVLVGKAVPYTRPGSASAINKVAVRGPVAVGAGGLEGDEQGDRRVHGGPDKAIHCYAYAHYHIWSEAFPGQILFDRPGAFGENLSIDGVDEGGVCIADRWQIGSALLEVSQGRQPCWKLNDRFAVPDMARRVQDSLRAGWYLRVIEPGHVSAGDAIIVQQRPFPDWTIARLLSLIRDRACEPALLREVLELPLPPSWQRLFRTRRDSGAVESWQSRLEGTPKP